MSHILLYVFPNLITIAKNEFLTERKWRIFMYFIFERSTDFKDYNKLHFAKIMSYLI